MADQKIIELEEKLKEVRLERNALKRELDVYKEKEEFINASVVKSKEAFDIANYNSQKIVVKALDFVTTMSNRIDKLLEDLDASKNANEAKDIIEKFVTKNKRYFAFTEEEKQKISEKVKDRLIARIKN